MIVTRKYIPRRTVLQALGTTLALPLLDAMTPALTRAAAATIAPLRLAFTYIPNGVTLAEWTPLGTGRDFQFSRILKPLEPFRDDLLALSGLAHRQANQLGDGGGDHARAAACFLTGVHPKKTAGSDIQAGISADQIAAQAVGALTRLPSLELGCEDTRTVGNCDSGYSCAYTNSLSWRGPSSPMPPETNPRSVFERLFGSGDDAGLDPGTRARRVRNRRSVLDLALAPVRDLERVLGASDRRKLDEYLYSVREIELRIEKTEKEDRNQPVPVEKPAGIPILFSDHLKLMFDLQWAAFQTDSTRVATLMVGREGSVRTYNEIGIPDPHHPLSHHRDNPEWVEKITRINCYHAELFAYFLGKLKSTPEGEGTLLDHSMIVYASAISDGNKHTHENLPVLVAGQGGGLKPGRHVVCATDTPMTNLYRSLLEPMGVRPASIGDSTGMIEELTALS
jgi:Protein of unknown function (DUF1552)